jgi:polyribonucleotide nucleotidyltransferase
VERKIGDQVLLIESGKLAKQASGAAVVRYGDTVVLVATVAAPGREGLDFFPLTVDYREKTYAAGKFPGGFLKREGRPTTKEILTMRLVDRPLRPLFPDGYTDEVQIMAAVLSADQQNDPDILALNGASAATFLSPAPFNGPVGAVRLGRISGEFVVLPTHHQLEESDLDLVIAGTENAITMIEGFAAEMSDDDMVAAILFGQEQVKAICAMQHELRKKMGVAPAVAPEIAPNPVFPILREKVYSELREKNRLVGKQQRAEAVSAVRDRIIEELASDEEQEGKYPTPLVREAFYQLQKEAVRDLIVDGTRPDGRTAKQLREITCEVGVLPRTHGAAIFTRGETQALVTVTLGTSRDEQRVDGLIEEYSKTFMLDYNFPPFSVGEVRPVRGPGRREIGHGALAERSVKPIMPAPEKFPYTVRVVSDILESNGSSSMASVCGATLALMDAGVPISAPVAGISIGLVKNPDGRHVLLTDIQGQEDHYGDMDFKIAGTQRGITGIQLDLKIDGIGEEIIRDTLAQAKEARMEMLRIMLGTIKRPREEISNLAPRLIQVRINPEKIGLLIGPGGKTIRSIQESTGANLDVEDDGTVTISCMDAEGAKRAQQRVEQLTEEVKVGKIYEGRVSSVKDFGAFVEILPGKDGLVHISELSEEYVQSVAEICKVGDTMPVKVIAIDDQDRVKLSRKVALRELGQTPEKKS